MWEIIEHPVFLTLLAALTLFAALRYWINKNKLDEKHFERCAESYQKIFEAYRTISETGYVSETDWQKIKEAHWIAKTFLPKDIARFTKDWARKSTDAYFLHQKIGRFGHIGTSNTRISHEKIDPKKSIKDEAKDEAAIILELKGKDPTPIYLKHLPTLAEST